MGKIVIDNHLLIWGIKKRANSGQEEMIERTAFFLKSCKADNTKIYVPSIVLGEFLTAVDPDKHKSVIKELNKSFIIPPYDAPASSIFAKLWREKNGGLIRKTREEMQATRQELKADCMIVATALAIKAEKIYSHDKKLKNFAGDKIRVLEVPECPPQNQCLPFLEMSSGREF